MKILVTGAGGLLGTELTGSASDGAREIIGLSRADLDVTDAPAVDAAFATVRPDVVIHAAAYTAVDRAEREADLAMAVNRDGTAHVASAARRHGASLVYVGTDFVFDGRQRTPYRPDDPTAPLGVYGRTKLAGEVTARQILGQDLLVVRTSWVYGSGGSNFVDAILRRAAMGLPLRVVADQHGRPTWARNLAGGLLELLVCGARGTFHLTDGGEATWLDVAHAALTAVGHDVPVEPVTTETWGAPAPRPLYSVLDVSATEDLLGRPLQPWREALKSYLSGAPHARNGYS